MVFFLVACPFKDSPGVALQAGTHYPSPRVTGSPLAVCLLQASQNGPVSGYKHPLYVCPPHPRARFEPEDTRWPRGRTKGRAAAPTNVPLRGPKWSPPTARFAKSRSTRPLLCAPLPLEAFRFRASEVPNCAPGRSPKLHSAAHVHLACWLGAD